MIRAFYASPRKAEKLGRTFTKTYNLSNTEATTLRDYYELEEGLINWTVAACLVVGGAAIKATAAIVGFGLATLTSQTLFGDCVRTLDNDFDVIATNGQQWTTVEVKYSYRRHGSYDGAYFISSVKVK